MHEKGCKLTGGLAHLDGTQFFLKNSEASYAGRCRISIREDKYLLKGNLL